MTKRMMVTATMVAITFASTVTLASLYSWNDAKRPPITLADALARAEKLLGDDAANRYCVSVSLYGDETGEGKKGAWNLLFAAADGSKKHVSITMNGTGTVRNWNGPIRPGQSANPADLKHFQRLLESFFRERKLDVKIQLSGDRLLASYKTRDFEVYREQNDGRFGHKLERVTGPEGDGLWLELRMVDQPDFLQIPFWRGGPYWDRSGGTYCLADPKRFLAVDFRYGRNLDEAITQSTDLWDIFGKELPR